MELLDVVNDNDKLTGEKIDREIVHSMGLWHREVGVIVLNENNEILLEKRAPTKKQSPNKWALCAGHIDSGETSDGTIVREMKEEIGIDVSINELRFLTVYKRAVKFNENQFNNAFLYTYLYKTNKKVSDYTIQEEELTEVKYFKIEEVEEAVKLQDENFAFSKENFIKELLTLLKEEIAKGEI